MIRLATVEDASRLAEIHVFGWRCAYQNFISTEYLLGKASVAKRIPAFLKALKENTEETYVLEENMLIKAFMTIGKSRDDDKPSSFELWGLYVEPLLMRNGIGTAMIKTCESIAIDRGYNENTLWVFKENDNARCFYEKLGYQLDSAEKFIEKFQTTEVRYCKQL